MDRVLKFKSMIKRRIVTNHILLAVVTFIRINFLAYIDFFCNTAFARSNVQKYHYQDNLSFVCLTFYKHNWLIILSGNICFCKQVKSH